MTKKIMSLTVLAIAAVFAFAFKAEPANFFADRQFELATGGNPNDPAAYTEVFNVPACLGSSSVCVLDVLNADVYTSMDAPDPSYIDKPKVLTGSTLAGEIADAIADPADPYPATGGRAIYKRN